MSRAEALKNAMAQVEILIAVARGIQIEVLQDGLEQSLIGDSLGPVVYPTEWLRLHKREERLRSAVRAVIAFKRSLDSILDPDAPVWP